MKKLILIITVLFLTVLLSSCMTGISKPPVNTEEVKLTYEKREKLPQEYPPEQAQKNGDVVNVHGTGYNVDKLDKFIDSYKTSKDDMIRITTYSTEGDAIIFDIIKSSEGVKLIYDYTRDKWSSRNKEEYNVTDIKKEDKDIITRYIVITDKGIELPLFGVKNIL